MIEEIEGLVLTVTEILKVEKFDNLTELVANSSFAIEETGYDNWNGGIYFYTVYLTVSTETFVKIRDEVQHIEAILLERFAIVTRHMENHRIASVTIVPKAQPKIDWNKLGGKGSQQKLIEDLNYLKNIMISVSTGGQRIQDVNDNYIAILSNVSKALNQLGLKHPNPFGDLWEWYAKWSSTFSTYRERRAFVFEMYNPLIRVLEENEQPDLISVTVDLSDWERVERSINEIQIRQKEAASEEQFQVVGLLGRETIITLAQAVYDKEKHPILDGKEVSKTDAKRMLEAYIAVELAGSSNEILRKYARATLDLANELTHKRTASIRDAALCTTATISLINLIGTIEGRI